MTRKINKLLIANRGEIACRVISTCQRLGIKTVAVFSDADANALHVAMADEAVHIGPAPAAESYLRADKILAAAKQTRADAVHPGYGFLSENPEFSEACAKNNIIFVGPSATSMRAMALKGAAKKLMVEADVPVVPGYHGDDQTLETLSVEAEKIGFPVLIKAVAGGGGKGMRTVRSAQELEAGIEAARREGENAFGNGKLLIEKLIEIPRHIELQVFGDSDGNAVHLFERDCSLQRRHQKVVEEAPAPGMSDTMRRAMGDAAVRAAESIGYEGAGTIEFIVDVANGLDDANFYFMEMNTRLQVEHPVTEMITGLDLVEWQLMIAEGQPLPLSQDEIDVLVDGHAVEVRLYAEDPENDFLPAIGKIGHFDPFADVVSGGRIDAGVRAGDTVTIHYDPMIGKLIAWGEDRAEAIETLTNLVTDTPVTGVTSNRDFLLRTLKHPDFIAGNVHTGFIAEHTTALMQPIALSASDYAMATFAIVAARQNNKTSDDPWGLTDNFRLNMTATEKLWFNVDGEGFLTADMLETGTTLTATIGDEAFTAENALFVDGTLTITIDGLQQRHAVSVSASEVTLVLGDRTIVVNRHLRDGSADDDADGPGTITAPMPGKILDVKVSEGEEVSKGDPLLVLEAMKMEQTITAPKDGFVTNLSVSTGDQITGGAVMLIIEEKQE
ncbi:MAG: methylcrotonoyl-CoA carboxylase [Kordiimonadales bacterium]|nr:MAG: methylcrotonoyl-CoA carboxylase [Kordiimonadales bacterium]